MKACQATGRDPDLVYQKYPLSPASGKSLALADLAIYEEVVEVFERLVLDGMAELAPDFPTLLADKACVHEYLEDLPGALANSGRTVHMLEVLVQKVGIRELARDLAGAYGNKAGVVQQLGDGSAAALLWERSIVVLEHLVRQEGQTDLAGELASTYMAKGVLLRAMGVGPPGGCDPAVRPGARPPAEAGGARGAARPGGRAGPHADEQGCVAAVREG